MSSLLEHLRIPGLVPSDLIIMGICRQMRYLQTLDLSEFKWLCEGVFSQLSLLPSLNSLLLPSLNELSDSNLQSLSSIKSLKHLSLPPCSSLLDIDKLTKLESLCLDSYSKPIDGLINRINKLTRLRSLDLSRTLLTDRALKALASKSQLRDLERLILDNCFQLTPKSLRKLSKFPKLHSVSFAGSAQKSIPINDGLLLHNMPRNLTRLGLYRAKEISQLQFLDYSPQLHSLDIGCVMNLSPEALARLASLNHLHNLNLQETRITNDVLMEILKSNTQLKFLSVEKCELLRSEGLSHTFESALQLQVLVAKLTPGVDQLLSRLLESPSFLPQLQKIEVSANLDVPFVDEMLVMRSRPNLLIKRSRNDIHQRLFEV